MRDGLQFPDRPALSDAPLAPPSDQHADVRSRQGSLGQIRFVAIYFRTQQISAADYRALKANGIHNQPGLFFAPGHRCTSRSTDQSTRATHRETSTRPQANNQSTSVVVHLVLHHSNDASSSQSLW